MRPNLTFRILIVAIYALPTGNCPGQNPPTITVSGIRSDAVWFASANALVVASCIDLQNCKLSAFELIGDAVRETGASESIKVGDYSNLTNIVVGGDRFLFNGVIYNVPSFNVDQRLENTVVTISPDGRMIGSRLGNTWCVKRLDELQSCSAQGTGFLMAVSDRAAVVWSKSVTEFVELRGSGKVTQIANIGCSTTNAGALLSGQIALSGCGSAFVVSPDGSTLLGLGRLVIGYDRIESDASGTWLLVSHPEMIVSTVQKAKELAVAVATLGTGISDETPNTLAVRVLNSETGQVCFGEVIPFKLALGMPATAISPDGSRVAIASAGALRIFEISKLCKANSGITQ